MSQVAAFFDIDGTIYREGLITEVFKKMVTHEIIPQSKWFDDVKPAYMAWDRREGDYDNYLSKMVEIFKEATRGISKDHIDLIAKRVIEQKGDRVYSYTREKIKMHQEMGHKVIAISGSPYQLVEQMAKKYNFDDWRGTIYQTDEHGIYTGEIIPMWDSESKLKAIHELSEIYDLDLSQCYSYGDTNGDFTMFQHTGHPTAMNPTKELLKKILNDEEVKEKIEVIVERKDVIYHMNTDCISFE